MFSMQVNVSVSVLTKNVDWNGLHFEVALTDDFSATFVDATIAWLNVVDSETIFFQRVFHVVYNNHV